MNVKDRIGFIERFMNPTAIPPRSYQGAPRAAPKERRLQAEGSRNREAILGEKALVLQGYFL